MKKTLLFLVILLFIASSLHLTSASTITLSKTEITHGEFFDIFGSSFGNATSTYSYVCFGSTDLCVTGAQIAAQPPMSWSDTQIHMQLPGNIPLEGDIIVVGEGNRTDCTASGVCQTTKFHQDKGRAGYKVKPKIDSTAPSSVIKQGDTLKIIGNGFGDTAGAVYFDDIPGTIINWGYSSIDVRTPSSLSANTKLLRVITKNGLQIGVAQIVSAPLTNDELSYQQYYLNQITVPGMWQTSPKKDVVVAVLDDGVYANHPDLAGHIWTNTKEIAGNGKDDDGNGYVDDYLGYNFLDNSANVDPKGGHGTFVAGIIGAVRNNNIGIAGIAERVKIMPVIISDGKTSSPELVKKGIQYAIDNGADIINISFASVGTLGFFQKDADIYQKAFDKGVLIVVAAGNRDLAGGIGQNLNLIPESPVCNNNNSLIMLGVAALDNADAASDGTKKATWASYGSNCVSISAPGTSIVSTVPPVFQKDGKFYDVQNGSSFSAPLVSGIAAYLKSVHPEWKNWEIMNRIIATAQSIDRANPDYIGQLGGRIDAQRALESTSIHPSVITLPNQNPRAGDTVRVTLNGFLSELSLRLTDKQSIDVPVPPENITAHAANEFDITLPRTLPLGTYYLRVISPTQGEVALSTNPLSVQEALPVPTTQSVITVPTFLAPSFDTQTSKVFPAPTTTMLTVSRAPSATAKRLAGSIVLQVQKNGEAWYIYPVDFKRYFLGRPSDAFQVMRTLGLGVTHDFITKYTFYPAKVAGKILLDTQDHGKAYYVNPRDKKTYYLGRPSDAFDVMRTQGLGIANGDLEKIGIGQ